MLFKRGDGERLALVRRESVRHPQNDGLSDAVAAFLELRKRFGLQHAFALLTQRGGRVGFMRSELIPKALLRFGRNRNAHVHFERRPDFLRRPLVRFQVAVGMKNLRVQRRQHGLHRVRVVTELVEVVKALRDENMGSPAITGRRLEIDIVLRKEKVSLVLAIRKVSFKNKTLHQHC